MRGVFAAAGDARAPVLHGPSAARPASAEDLDTAVAAAVAAATAGHGRHTWILDPTTRVRIDARRCKARRLVRDEAALRRMMGGKDRLLRPDRSFALLSVLEILRPDGALDLRAARKYKQVEHFAALCRPVFAAAAAGLDRPLRVVDLACGTGHLTLAAAEALYLEGIEAEVLGVERDGARVAAANEKAAMLPGRRVRFEAGTIEDAARAGDGRDADVVVALHACDTATCDAIVYAVERRARAILLAPCCQAEVAAQLERGRVPVPALADGLLRAEFGAVLTDALRTELLRALGYDTKTVPFAHGTHTSKNLLIRAVAPAAPGDRASVAARLAPVAARARALGVHLRSIERLAGER